MHHVVDKVDDDEPGDQTSHGGVCATHSHTGVMTVTAKMTSVGLVILP